MDSLKKLVNNQMDGWLNDKVIFAYAHSMQRRSHTSIYFAICQVVNPNFWVFWDTPCYKEEPWVHAYDWHLENLDVLLIPIPMRNNHWVLGHVFKEYNTDTNTIPNTIVPITSRIVCCIDDPYKSTRTRKAQYGELIDRMEVLGNMKGMIERRHGHTYS